MRHPILRVKHAYLALRRAVDASVAPFGLTAAQFDVVQELLHQDGMEHGELQRRLAVSSPTLTNTIDRMESARLVEKHVDPRDGRVRRIYLSKRVREACQAPEFRQAGQALVEQMFHGVTAVDRERFLHVADLIAANLQQD